MNRAEVFLGTTLESRFRLDVIVRESPDFIVFQGHDLQRSKVVDVRVARALRGMSEEELRDAIERFTEEAEQLRKLSSASPHVEELLASGQLEGPDQEHVAYCVFAHCDGKPLSLSHPTGSSPMPLTRAVAMLEPVASALSTAHELGLFHGDVRPENLVAIHDVEKTTLKLVGFTRATRLGNANAARTFSAAYGAPEHHKKSHGDSGVGPPTDTYGLALCLVELVTGQPPLSGTSPSELYKQASDITQRPTLRARGAAVSQEIDAIVERAVAVNPKLRWPSTREFWSALTAATAVGNAVTAPIVIPVGPITPPAAPSSSDPIPAIGLLDASALAEAAGAAFAELPPVSLPPQALPPANDPPSVTPAPSIEPLPSPKKKSGRKLLAFLVLAIVAGAAVVFALRMRSHPIVTGTAPTPPPPASSSAPPIVAAPSSAPVASTASVPIVSRPTPEGMIRVPAGTFTMGVVDGKADRLAHKVALSHAFYIDRTEVTIEKYNACVDKGACTARTVHLKKMLQAAWGCNLDKEHGTYPANCVDRKQAIAYCAFVNKRLPTEAEWEYAARGTDEREYPWGNAAPKTCSLAVLSGMTGACGDRHGTSPVGIAPDGASPFGVLDMGGNVWEWVADDYAVYPTDEVKDPMVTSTGSADAVRGILRGGSWDYGPESAKTTYRLPFVADAGNASTGVRCALSE